MKFYSDADRRRGYRENREKFPGYVMSPMFSDREDAVAYAKQKGMDARRINKDPRTDMWFVTVATLNNS